ncbi:hypothetical protein [Tomitella biformata]|uniref:hypothetical protein n=1 Tax=Tomitella biformata TaxID=630403 RepID=UPI0004661A79|nr:hypothetical protein [Tomitella biformata]
MTPKKRMPPRYQPGDLSLLAEILTDRPNLTDAACRGAWRLVDEALHPQPNADPSAARARLTALCRTCPARAACSESLVNH